MSNTHTNTPFLQWLIMGNHRMPFTDRSAGERSNTSDDGNY